MGTISRALFSSDAEYEYHKKLYEDITPEQRARWLIAFWTEGMSPLEQARAEGYARSKAKAEVKTLAEAIDLLRSINAPQELIERANTELAATRINLG